MKYILLLVILFPLKNYAQVDWRHLQKNSSEIFVYKISAAQAELFIKIDSIDVDAFASQAPYKKFEYNDDESQLAIGHYVLISVHDNRVVARLMGVSDLFVYTINNQHRVQLAILDKQQHFINNAQVWVNNKPAKQDKSSGNYFIRQKYPDEAIVKVFTPGDTLFTSLWAEYELYKTVGTQRWNNFKESRFSKIVTWVPKQLVNIFKNKSYHTYSKAGTGTIVFNQAKYKNTDTVKLKSYIFNTHGKQYNKPAYIYLEYYSKGNYKQQQLAKLNPSHPGSFIYQFKLSDTLTNDINYNIVFRDSKKRQLVRNYFKLEDYLPDEVSKLNLRTSKENYFPNDSMNFYVSATDANGLQLLDANATLILTTGEISEFYKDSIYIPDTLITLQKPLQSEGETRFSLPANDLPGADMSIHVTALLKNSNNEIQSAGHDIMYHKASKMFFTKINNDSINVEYKMNGKSVRSRGLMVSDNEYSSDDSVWFPCKIKIDPFSSEYKFYLIANGKREDSVTNEIDNLYNIGLSRISIGDTLGFSLYNPKKVPVSFSIFFGNHVIASGRDDKENIIYKFKSPNKNRIYRVKWQYYWAGEEKTKEGKIALLYKVLKIDIKDNDKVFPGQKDTIHINVEDYKSQPATDVNLTAVSYNIQLQKDIHVNEPPYLVNYNSRQYINHDKFETDDAYFIKQYPIGQHSRWIKNFGLDSLQFYQMLYPGYGYKDFVTHISQYLPQVAVHVTKNGERQEIYLLYINNNIVYYNGASEQAPYSFSCFPGYVKIGIRLLDKLIETDSIYIQPGYKHDIFFDIDKLDSNAEQISMPDYFSQSERSILEKNFWQLDNNYKTNNAYVWQNDEVIKLYKNEKHIVGPFNTSDSMHFFVPGYFDLNFKFEPGYEYNLSPKISRLEKKPLFDASIEKIYLKKINSPGWKLGDTIVDPPLIHYSKPVSQFYLEKNYFKSYTTTPGSGKLLVTWQKDSLPAYIVLYNEADKKNALIADGGINLLDNIKPGFYSLLVVAKNNNVCHINQLLIKAGETLCIKTEQYQFVKNDSLLSQFKNGKQISINEEKQPEKPTVQFQNYEKGDATVNGKIIDAKGKNPIAFVTVTIKGTKTGVISSADGTFSFPNIKHGKIILVASTVGYTSKEISVDVEQGKTAYVLFALNMMVSNLNEVVVTGYGISRKSELTSSLIVVKNEEITNAIQGKANGVSIDYDKVFFDSSRIIIRGNTSYANNNNAVYVIDGIVYNQMPENITPDIIASISVMKSEEAIAAYGSIASDGAVIITTNLKTQRTQFRDYAFWQPEIFTDKNGHASFVVEYPDNITGWQTYVLAMDKKRRIGKAMSIVKSFRPLSAQLRIPQFLIEGDSVKAIGKLLNYSDDNYTVHSQFTIDGKVKTQPQVLLESKSSQVENNIITTNSNDSVKASFALQTTTGFKDEEERKIPVLRKGTEVTKGDFQVMMSDTTINFIADSTAGNINFLVQNNTLDVLLNEINHLQQYPYYCMEQVASKLKGLLAEQQIKQALHQPFKNEKTLQKLLLTLEKSQLYDGGWSWWPNGNSNLYITNYVINALLPLRAEPIVETNIRNGLLYLQNKLNYLNRDELLTTLATMSNARHLIDYASWIDKIYFDSLTQYQQWLLIKIKQQQQIDYSVELKKELKKAIPGMLGSIHWGEENYSWYNDAGATTLIAFDVLQQIKQHDDLLHGIVQYFLEAHSSGYWANTVQSASIVSTIQPYILSLNKNFNQQPVIKVAGDTSFEIQSFPFQKTFNGQSIKKINVSKSGGGLIYCTLYQDYWNHAPDAFEKFFKINSSFVKDGNSISTLVSGESINLEVNVTALADADYVMIEIPIPAGCTYKNKNQEYSGGIYKEFFMNKVVVFAEHLGKGKHDFSIPLESRYSGAFTLNPAKASLMYFPVFYGNNKIKKVDIK